MYLIDILIFRFVTEYKLNWLDEMVNDTIELWYLHLNIHSFNTSVHLLRQFLYSIQLDFYVIILTEVWSTNLEF